MNFGLRNSSGEFVSWIKCTENYCFSNMNWKDTVGGRRSFLVTTWQTKRLLYFENKTPPPVIKNIVCMQNIKKKINKVQPSNKVVYSKKLRTLVNNNIKNKIKWINSLLNQFKFDQWGISQMPYTKCTFQSERTQFGRLCR